MNRWRSFNAWCVTLILAVATSGCYSGWSRSKGGGGDGSESGPGKSAPSTKKIGLAIVDVISMTSDALTDRGCSTVPVSLVDLRMGERDLRFRLLSEALEQIAEVRSYRVTNVDASDCGTLASIERDAVDEDVSGLIDGVSIEVKAKPVVHIRLVYWLGDQAGIEPSEAVVATDWRLMNALANAGFDRRLSVNQFVLTPRNYNGYVGAWSARASPMGVYYPPTVDTLTPDQEGVEQLQQAVQEGTQGFAVWLLNKVSRL